MRAAGLFCDFFQRRFVGVGEGGGDRALRLEDRFDEIGSLIAGFFDAVILNEAAHDIRGVFVAGAGEAFEFIRQSAAICGFVHTPFSESLVRLPPGQKSPDSSS